MMLSGRRGALHLAFSITLAGAGVAVAQDTDWVGTGVRQYREMTAADNPAELHVDRGGILWTARRGPKNASLEACDLGLGLGVVKGALARLPRYFGDTDRVEDLESRLLTCMVTLQGLDAATVKKGRFGTPAEHSDLEALAAWIASESRGARVEISLEHPKMREAYRVGERIFYRRAGPHDFSCAGCHTQDEKRIRLQELPNLTTAEGARESWTTWPAYRLFQGELRTIQWMLFVCYRNMRLPQLDYASDGSIALLVYIAANAHGGLMDSPSVKR